MRTAVGFRVVAIALVLAGGACAGRGTPPRLPGSALPARAEAPTEPDSPRPAAAATEPHSTRPPGSSSPDRTGAAATEPPSPRPSGSALPPRPESASDEPTAWPVSPLVQTALGLQGTRYRYGGANRAGMDCSGLVQYVFAEHGIALPRGVKEQFALGDRVPLDRVQPGDLVFFSLNGGVSHVGIAVDRDTFVHAPNSSGVVRVERLTAEYWARQFAGARRIR